MHTEVRGNGGSLTERASAARGAQPELRLVEPVAPPDDKGQVLPVSGDQATAARLDASDLEALLLNLDAALRVHVRAHLFTWTQGLLLQLIRHRVLICALRKGNSSAFMVDSFSTLVADTKLFGDQLMRDASLASFLTETWKRHRFTPFVCKLEELNAFAGGMFVRELKRAGAGELLVHGSHDAEGEVQSLFVFACQPGSTGVRETYLMQLLAPCLHAAWVRTQTRAAPNAVRGASVDSCVLTERERSVLRWVYLGKSNGEIGAILNISSLTVKNHVQKILRKLNVVNRAQAVGRALDARIIRP
jgi:transcriptional regulator EpsA